MNRGASALPATPYAVDESRSPKELSWQNLLCLLVPQLWAAHALAFFAHEYAHSFTAWVLGWKSNPLALHYPHPTLTILLLQFGINQNVDEAALFAQHHEVQGALISAAGMVLGNALFTYPLSRWAYNKAKRRQSAAWSIFWYWVTIASVGNLIDYVPIRTFVQSGDLDQDMLVVEKGWHWSPWTLLLLFGIPSAVVLAKFLLKDEPRTLTWLFPQSFGKRAVLACLTAFALFDFYGAAGWSDCGSVSHRMSVISVTVIAPLAAMLALCLVRPGAHAAPVGEPPA